MGYRRMFPGAFGRWLEPLDFRHGRVADLDGSPPQLISFEVTRRFGMETRHRAHPAPAPMVVVEGVAGSLTPVDKHMGSCFFPRPIVEDYIKENVGPNGASEGSRQDRAGARPVPAEIAADRRGGRSSAASAATPLSARKKTASHILDACGRRDHGGWLRAGQPSLTVTTAARSARPAGPTGTRREGCPAAP